MDQMVVQLQEISSPIVLIVSWSRPFGLTTVWPLTWTQSPKGLRTGSGGCLMAFSPQVAQEILRKMDWKIREALTLCSGEILLRIIVLLTYCRWSNLGFRAWGASIRCSLSNKVPRSRFDLPPSPKSAFYGMPRSIESKYHFVTPCSCFGRHSSFSRSVCVAVVWLCYLRVAFFQHLALDADSPSWWWNGYDLVYYLISCWFVKSSYCSSLETVSYSFSRFNSNGSSFEFCDSFIRIGVIRFA
jgi:hypothetical protein